ncbi:MAG: cyclic nucleotide-binding domain-containing protein [Elusimicrobiota bacterium]
MLLARVRKLPVGTKEMRWLGLTLRSSEVFGHLRVGQVEEILNGFVLYRYPRDCVVIEQGDKDQALYVLFKGRVVVTRRRWGLFSTPIRSLLPGDVFGEMALIYRAPRFATVTTTEPSDVFMLSAADFTKMLDKSPKFKDYLTKKAEQRKVELEKW